MAVINPMRSIVLTFLTLSCLIRLKPSLAQAQIDTNLRIQNSFKAGLIGDAMALGGHNEHDAKKIKSAGGYHVYTAPGYSNNGAGAPLYYYPGRVAGDLTDTGDVAIMLLEHLVDLKRNHSINLYSFDSFAAYWKLQMDQGYGSCNWMTVGRNVNTCPPHLKPGYVNAGARRTLHMLRPDPTATGSARKLLTSKANCLFAATHFLPLFFTIHDQEALIAASVDTVYIAHSHEDPIAAAEFLARSLYGMFYHDMALEPALRAAAVKMNSTTVTQWLDDAIAKVVEAKDPTSDLSKEEHCDDLAISSMARLWHLGKKEPLKIGKSAATEGALPAALYFALKYQDDFEEAIISNSNVGGDSAGRGMVIGMLLGAKSDWYLAPTHRWLKDLNALPRVQKMMDSLRPMVLRSVQDDFSQTTAAKMDL